MRPAVRERRLTVSDGVSLFVCDWGDPDDRQIPLLCLPGLTRNSQDFSTLARRLAPRRLICPDMRGRGRSDYAKDWRTYNPAAYLDDIRQLLAAFGVHRVVVVGVSLGGLLGMAIAAAYPTVLAGLIIDDVGPDIGTRGAGRILDYISRDRPQADWPAAVAHLRAALPNLTMADDEEWLTFTKATFRERDHGKLHFDWDINLARPIAEPPEPTPDLWLLWRAVRNVPVLAIRGAASDILSAETFARMQAEKPDMIPVTVPGTGHCPTLNEPPVRKAIDDFLSTL
jgi:pimeloyl-ACP methyl ester carboxylesterase